MCRRAKRRSKKATLAASTLTWAYCHLQFWSWRSTSRWTADRRLFFFEDYNVFAHISTSQLKILAVVKDGLCKQNQTEESVLRQMLRQLNQLYVDAASNPFFAGLETEKFRSRVTEVVEGCASRFQ
mmetsp:Transcript_163370/g.523804  ORF Transcript_163370/g.523804 Transcript_163370/m.523804 type:complete len:126 (+) Transcript_163370:224-601(+)